MAAGRTMGVVALVLLAACAPAQAASLPVLGADGNVERRTDPGVAARDRTPVTHREDRRSARRGPRDGTVARAAAERRTVPRELERLRRSGEIRRAAKRAARDEYRAFKQAVKRFSGARRTEMAGVLATVDGIAARGDLTASRIAPLWLTMRRNRQWWNEGSLLASGQRVGFEGSELVWQYVPGSGLHIHPLANFGKLNALWRGRLDAGRMEALMDELLPLAAERAGGTAWEYYFDFGGGRPPWVSSLAQGTGLQSMARAARRSGRQAELIPELRRGLAVFRTRPPEGVRTRGKGGKHYAQYSYAPRLRILNGFVQSLVGLFDFATISGDPAAHQLFVEGEASARNEVPAFDTGAWSLYSRGSITRESDLNYHGVLIDFLVSLCDRTASEVHCGAVERFERYEDQPPVLELVTRRLRGGRQGELRFDLSKISSVTVRVLRADRTVLARTATLGYGRRSWVWDVPRRKGRYTVRLAATDLAGNSASVTGQIRVLRPKQRSRST